MVGRANRLNRAWNKLRSGSTHSSTTEGNNETLRSLERQVVANL